MSSEDRKCQCPPSCNDCDRRFRCLNAGVPLPHNKRTTRTADTGSPRALAEGVKAGMEAAAGMVDAESQRILSRRTGGQDFAEAAVDRQLWIMAHALSETATSIRAVSGQPAVLGEVKSERRYCQGCGAYYPTVQPHKDGNRVCQLDASGECKWVKK